MGIIRLRRPLPKIIILFVLLLGSYAAKLGVGWHQLPVFNPHWGLDSLLFANFALLFFLYLKTTMSAAYLGQRILDTVPSGVGVLKLTTDGGGDRNFRWENCSNVAAQDLGYDPRGTGKLITDVALVPSATLLQEYLMVLDGGVAIVGREVWRSQGTERRWFSESVSRIDSRHLLLTWLDISAIKQAELRACH
ncbi:MAG: hypothetical protein AAF889_11200 [Cyanobacteria bacterium P01_D01_bin.73]